MRDSCAEALPYRHVQMGWAIIALLGLPQVGLWAVVVTTGKVAPAVPAIALAVIEPLFMFLAVAVDEAAVTFRFGIGLVRKTIPLTDVVTCRPVRNSVLCGWGIRYIGNGWLYNVSGWDAVELGLRNGRRLRIGTDDPQGLAEAITGRIS